MIDVLTILEQFADSHWAWSERAKRGQYTIGAVTGFKTGVVTRTSGVERGVIGDVIVGVVVRETLGVVIDGVLVLPSFSQMSSNVCDQCPLDLQVT